LRRRSREAGPREAGYLPLLEGYVALSRGDFSRAATWLEAAASDSPEMGLPLLAQAYAASGQGSRSTQALEKLVAMPSQALGWEAQEWWLEAHAALARAYLERGDRARASKVARELAGRLRNADGDLPLARTAAELSSKAL
jgi:hypothetical protein